MRVREGVEVDDEVLDAFCRRHGFRRVAAFGSVLRDDFRSESDVDLLVEFLPGAIPGLLRIAAMELELGAILGREVELHTYGDLSQHFRDRVRAEARELYAA